MREFFRYRKEYGGKRVRKEVSMHYGEKRREGEKEEDG